MSNWGSSGINQEKFRGYIIFFPPFASYNPYFMDSIALFIIILQVLI